MFLVCFLLHCVCACVCVCVNRIWLCGLWQPCSSPEGCGLAQSQWRPGTDGEGKLHPICHPPFLIIKVFSGAVILLRDSLCLNPGASWDRVLLASEVMTEDISSQMINIDRTIGNDNDNNYVIHEIWDVRSEIIDSVHTELLSNNMPSLQLLIAEKVKRSFEQIFEFLFSFFLISDPLSHLFSGFHLTY